MFLSRSNILMSFFKPLMNYLKFINVIYTPRIYQPYNKLMLKKNCLILALSSSNYIGYIYSLDTPSKLQIPLRKQPYNFTTTSFNLIYFCTFILSALFSLPFGRLLDKLPVKKTLMAILIIILATQIVISLMFQFLPEGYLPIILIMRSIFGILGQSLSVLQGIIIPMYAGQEFQLLSALSLTIPFAFASFNSLITTAVYNQTKNLPLAWYIGCGAALLSVISGLLMCKFILTDMKQPEMIENEKNVELKENPEKIDHPQKNEDQNLQNHQTFCQLLKNVGLKFWILVVFIFFVQSSLGPFLGILNEFMVSRFGFTYTDTGKMLMIPQMGLIIFSFLTGMLMRKIATARRKIILASAILFFIGHIGLYFLPNATVPEAYHYGVVIVFLFFMSFKFAVYCSAILTSASYFVKQNCLGTAWGMINSIIGWSKCMIPLVQTAIIDSDPSLAKSYKSLSLFMLITSLVSMGFSIFINCYDFTILDKYYKDAVQSNDRKKDNELADTNIESARNLVVLKKDNTIDLVK